MEMGHLAPWSMHGDRGLAEAFMALGTSKLQPSRLLGKISHTHILWSVIRTLFTSNPIRILSTSSFRPLRSSLTTRWPTFFA